MRLTAHINSSQARMAWLEEWLGQMGTILIGMLEGAMEGSLLDQGTSDASGDDGDDQDGGEGNGDAGVSLGGV